METDLARLELEAKTLDVRLKELDVKLNDDDRRHRQSFLQSSITSTIVIAATIAAWASLTAAGQPG
jgi:hypothetical protein